MKRRKGWRMSCDVGEATNGSLHLRHRSFYNPSAASPTLQALHLRHLASQEICCTAPGVPPFHLNPHHFPFTEWLRPKLVGSRCSLRALQALPSRQLTILRVTILFLFIYLFIFLPSVLYKLLIPVQNV